MDNVSSNILTIAMKCGSYIDAIIAYKDKFPDMDFNDVLDLVDPIIKERTRQEFINKNYLPHLKRNEIPAEFL